MEPTTELCVANDSSFGCGIPLSRQFRGGFSIGEIQRLGRPAREGFPERATYHVPYPIGTMPPLAISSPERCPVCVGDAAPEAASEKKNPYAGESPICTNFNANP